jgi:glycosyltransferase involved in cell wall biosynthesis
MLKLSIIVPAYNEEKTVGEVLERLLAVPFAGWATEVIVVNDASTDGTLAAIKNFSSRVIIINLPKNGGKGSAVNAGLKVATGDFAIIQDADLECRPEEIPFLLVALGQSDSTKTAVIGSRETNDKNPKQKSLSRFGSLLITKLINLFYSSSLTDASMCYKLFPRATFGYFGIGGFEAELLFILRLLKNGYHIIEVPVSYVPRGTNAGKKIRYRDGIKIILRIIRFRITGR